MDDVLLLAALLPIDDDIWAAAAGSGFEVAAAASCDTDMPAMPAVSPADWKAL